MLDQRQIKCKRADMEDLNVSNIIAEVGSKAIQERVGVGASAVRNARSADKFPAQWYFVIRELCVENGLDYPPDSAFTFKGLDKTP